MARVYGTEQHPSIASSLHNLAGVLQAQGDLDGAIQIYERVLDIEHAIHRTRELHTTGVTEMNLAQMLMHRGRRERAVELLQHALAVFTAQLPAGHDLTRQAQGLLAAAMDGAPASPHMPGRNAAPFVLHALAVCGPVSVRAERLQRIAFRVVLYAKAGKLMPLLLLAEQAQGSPGLMTDAPEYLLLPAAAPPRIADDWPGLVDQLGRLRRSFASDATAFLAPLLRDGCIDAGALVRHGLRPAEPDDDDWRALFDEVTAVVQGADVDELQAELSLWTHAVRELLQRGDDEDSTPLAHALLAALPQRRDALLGAWSDVLTDDQRAQL
jgi:tetratricopeptide (TPR) repeat protein